MNLVVPDAPSAGLHQALLSWRDWGLPLSVQPTVVGLVPGGRTNRNYHLRTYGQGVDLVLRLNTRFAPRLGIRRTHEKEILQAVAEQRLAIAPLYWDPEGRYTIFPYTEARTWNAIDFADPRRRRQVWDLVEAAQKIKLATPVRRYSDYLMHYWQQLELAGVLDSALRYNWQVFYPKLFAFDEQRDWEPKLTHHDLIPENILETEDRIYLIDWEYAAMGHPEIDRWCLDSKSVSDPFVDLLARWTNDLWERLVLTLK